MSTALNDTINFQRRLRALSALFLYRLTSLAVSVGYFQRRKLGNCLLTLFTIETTTFFKETIYFFDLSFSCESNNKFQISRISFFFFFHLSHSVSSDLIKNNEYVFFIRYIPGNENYIRNRNEFFFLTFSRLYFRKSIRDSEAKNFLKYVQTVSYFTLKKGRTL